MKFFFFLFFLLICVLDGFKTWIKPFSIRLTNYALLDRLQDGIRDEPGRPKDLNVPSKSSLPHNARWEFMYRATVDYCQQHQQLPHHDCVLSFEGYDDLNLGVWVTSQKQRYDGKGRRAFLTDEQLNKLMAIDEFREWAEDPLRDNDVRWEFMYRAIVDYCQHNQRLPFADSLTIFNGYKDLNVGRWVDRQKLRYKGESDWLLSDEQRNKLMAVNEFREWAEDPLRDDDVRWEFMCRLTADYCQQHQQLPPQEFIAGFEGLDDLNIGNWVAMQKKRYDGKGRFAFLTDEQLNMLMFIDEFREWAKDPLRDDDVRWEFMYRLFVDHCHQYQQLPLQNDTIISIDEHDDLNLGKWVAIQKRRYDGKEGRTALDDEQLRKLMTVDEFREWAEDPLRDDDVRWEFMYQRLLHGNFSGDYNLDNWYENQKERYKEKNETRCSPLKDEQKTKLMAIARFRKWAENPFRDPAVRWEIHFDLLAEYCYFHQKLPLKRQKTSYDCDDGISRLLNLGIWLSKQKAKYSGSATGRMTEEQHDKLMQIPEFKSWTFRRFGTTVYSNFFDVKVKKSVSKEKSTPNKQ